MLFKNIHLIFRIPSCVYLCEACFAYGFTVSVSLQPTLYCARQIFDIFIFEEIASFPRTNGLKLGHLIFEFVVRYDRCAKNHSVHCCKPNIARCHTKRCIVNQFRIDIVVVTLSIEPYPVHKIFIFDKQLQFFLFLAITHKYKIAWESSLYKYSLCLN